MKIGSFILLAFFYFCFHSLCFLSEIGRKENESEKRRKRIECRGEQWTEPRGQALSILLIDTNNIRVISFFELCDTAAPKKFIIPVGHPLIGVSERIETAAVPEVKIAM